METTTVPVDLSQLTPAQIDLLKKQLEDAEKQKKQNIAAERETYKTIVDDTVQQSFKPLVGLSKHILNVKKLVFDNFESVVEMKADIYGTKKNQQSHTFTSTDGNISIKIGHRITDNYDDTVSAGVEKVKNYMYRLADDTKSKKVERILDLLLRTDKNGNLKPSRVLELVQFANEEQDEELSDGVRIIENSYKPLKSCQFIEVKFKDDRGFEHSLPLSISAFGLDDEPVTQEEPELPQTQAEESEQQSAFKG